MHRSASNEVARIVWEVAPNSTPIRNRENVNLLAGIRWLQVVRGDGVYPKGTPEQHNAG